MDDRQILEAINRARNGIEQYLQIMDMLPRVDVSQDCAFQRKYKAFYKVRRGEDWCRVYFSYMESGKVNPPSFESTIDHIFTTLRSYEPSFSSKLVATLDPHQPIWDEFVIRHTEQKPPRYGVKDRVERAKVVYRSIQQWYQRYLETDEAKRVIELFDQEVEEYDRVTDLKKFDFVLWQTRG